MSDDRNEPNNGGERAEVVFVPSEHVCDGLGGRVQGTLWRYQEWDDLRRWAVGTVRQCRCGRSWVAGEMPGLMPSIWRAEGRLERWLRRRKTPRVGRPRSSAVEPDGIPTEGDAS